MTRQAADRGSGALTVLATALGVRPQLVLLGPLVPWLGADFAASHASLGLVGTAALLATAAGASAAGRVEARSGPGATITRMLVVLLAAIVLRALAPGVAWLLAASVGAGLAIGVISALLPAWMFDAGLPARVGSASYTIGMVGGSILAGLAAAPLAAALGGWRGAVLALGTVTALAAVAWLRRPLVVSAARPRVVGRSTRRIGLLLAVAFGLQAAVYQGLAQ